jgi:hypothetical protein
LARLEQTDERPDGARGVPECEDDGPSHVVHPSLHVQVDPMGIQLFTIQFVAAS